MHQIPCIPVPPQNEFCVLLRHCAGVQARCSEHIAAQQAHIARLQADGMRLRAAVIVRDTTIQGLQQELAQLRAAHPGLPRRRMLVAQIDALLQRVQGLMREKLRWQHAQQRQHALPPGPATEPALPQIDAAALSGSDSDALSSHLSEADLVICQAGCVSHNDYWRLHNHCRRTGKQCILIDQPDALRIVRVQALCDDAPADVATPESAPVDPAVQKELSLFPGATD